MMAWELFVKLRFCRVVKYWVFQKDAVVLLIMSKYILEIYYIYIKCICQTGHFITKQFYMVTNIFLRNSRLSESNILSK